MSSTIGYFTEQRDGSYQGTIRTLTVNAKLHIVPTDRKTPKSPNFRVLTEWEYEIGAGWTQVGQKSGDTYMRISIEVPEFGRFPVYATLVKDKKNTTNTGYTLYFDADRPAKEDATKE